LLLDLVLPFTKQTWDLESRRVALSSIGEICQQKTKFFTRADIEKAFKLPFINKDATLTRVVLTQFLDFLAAAERRSDTGAQIAVGAGATQGAERLETSFTASDNDHATTHIARTFLREIVNTALGDSYELAFSATRILASISRQGLLHPKECGAALVALSTSTLHAPGGDSGKTSSIAIVAAQEQKNIHLQHETMFEKEYVTAVDMAFDYHCDVLKDSHGALGTFKPKMQLLFGALKEGTGKSLKSFITNVFRRLHFDLPALNVESDASVDVPRTALYTRFCLENFAFFDYGQVGEVYHVIATIESIVLKQIGPTVALAIETEMTEQQTQEPAIDGAAADGNSTEPVTETASKQAISDQRLRHLAVASMILHMMWETRSFLRKAYNLQGKITASDMKSKAIRNNLVKSEALWDQIASIIAAIDSQATMRKECYEFAEIINVDREHAVADDEADAKEQLARAAAGYEVTAAGYETPDEGPRGESAMPTSGRGRKRKSSAGIGNTPKKARGRPAGSRNKKRNSRTPDEDSD
jgi:cohesin loading factor subunit SCC2